MILFTRFHKSLGSVDLKGPDDWHKSGEQIFKMTNLLYAEFLATLVALHFTPVSESVAGQSFGLQLSSVAWSLRACFCLI